jgi:hypothetical protein
LDTRIPEKRDLGNWYLTQAVRCDIISANANHLQKHPSIFQKVCRHVVLRLSGRSNEQSLSSCPRQ